MKNDPIFQEKYDELKLQMAMHLLEQKELDDIQQEILDAKEKPEYQPTAYNKKVAMTVIHRTLIHHKRKIALQKASHILQKVSVFLVVFLLGLCTTIITVDAVRVPFINWLISLQENSTTIHFQVENDIPSIDFGELSNDYIINLDSSAPGVVYYSIIDQKGNEIFLTVCSLDVGLTIDTENAQTFNILINGKKALGINKDDVITIVYSGKQNAYILEADLPLEKLVSIAENLTIY